MWCTDVQSVACNSIAHVPLFAIFLFIEVRSKKVNNEFKSAVFQTNKKKKNKPEENKERERKTEQHRLR